MVNGNKMFFLGTQFIAGLFYLGHKFMDIKRLTFKGCFRHFFKNLRRCLWNYKAQIIAGYK